MRAVWFTWRKPPYAPRDSILHAASMPNYRRNFLPGGSFFFTVNLLDRRRGLLTRHIDLLRDSVRRVRRLYPFRIEAWVVLPDRLHCVWTLPP